MSNSASIPATPDRSFIVRIAGRPYRCEVLGRRPGYGRVRIAGLNGKYICTFRRGRPSRCTCPAFQFSPGPEKSCKHVRAIADRRPRP